MFTIEPSPCLTRNSSCSTRGYAVLSFDGPGQGLSSQRDQTILRPDWDHVTTKVLDYLFDSFAPRHDRLELDPNRIAIIGANMGGLLRFESIGRSEDQSLCLL